MKIIKRILIVVLSLIAAFLLFLVGSVLVDSLAGRGRLEAVTNTRIPGVNGSPEVRAYVARPQGEGPFPAVIMIHEFYGLNESIVGKADGLAQEGYVVIAPDTFRGSTTAWIPRAIYQVITTKPEAVNQDLDAVYDYLEGLPEVDAGRIAIMGFCYGGRTSLLYSLHNNRLAATAIFYGSLETDAEALKSLPGPVLGIFGGADQSIPLAEVDAFEQALQQAGVPHEISVYEGQPHAFVTSMEDIRAGGVQGEAWAQLLGFLEKNLKAQSSGREVKPQSAEYTAAFAWRYYGMLVFEHAFGSASHRH
ncbi:MAG: dienelactone hydrolase family protein [Anaerolineae bacterium]|nr:dienelactone hydrolase family protein [Anaerolineae bacterium]